MNRPFAGALAALALSLPLATRAQDPAAEAARAIQPYSGFRTHALAAWHPSRREMLVLHGPDGAQAVHRVPEPGAAPQVLPATAGATRAAWQPAGGETLVFIAPGPEGMPRVQRYDASTQSVAMVSPPGERAIDFAWNAAGDRIAYTTLEAAGTRSILRLVDPLRPATQRQLARLEGTWTDLSFGVNGRRIAAVQVVSERESHLWQIGVATGTARRVTRPDGRRPASWRSPQFTPDGLSLLALTDRGSETRRLVVVPVAGGAERVLSAHLPHDVELLAASADAGLAAFVTREHGAHVMRFLDLVTLKEQPRPPLFEGVIGGLAWRPGSREIGFHISSARTAGDVFSYDARANQMTRWTNGNNPAVNARELPEPRLARWKGADGADLTALVYGPPTRFTGRRPVIVDHRAAPGTARAGFLGPANHLVNGMGFAVVRPNLRRPDDLASLLDWVATQPEMDPARTLVIGEGAGGAMEDEDFVRAALDFARRSNP